MAQRVLQTRLFHQIKTYFSSGKRTGAPRNANSLKIADPGHMISKQEAKRQSSEQFEMEYKAAHYSKRRAINDVVEQIYFPDHSKQMQYEFLKSLNKQNEEIDHQNEEIEHQTDAEYSNNGNSKTFEIDNKQFRHLMELSSSSKTATDLDETQSPRTPESPNDLSYFIERINLNNHLLTFFVKYQKLFQSPQYVALLLKLKKNVDNLEDIREMETKKYENKRKILQKINPDAKLKHKPVFMNAEETKSHFGYPLLLRNLKQKMVKYELWRVLQLIKALIQFDNRINDEFFEIIQNRFKLEKNDLSALDLVRIQYLNAYQSEQRRYLYNYGSQKEVVNELLNRPVEQFTVGVVSQILKLRIFLQKYSLSQISSVFQMLQPHLSRNITEYSTKQLMELAAVILNDKIPIEKYFAELLFISILKNLPQEQSIKHKAAISLLNHFRDKKLRYTLDSESRSTHSKKNVWDSAHLSAEEDQELQQKTKDSQESKSLGVFEVEGLFEGLLSSVVTEISRGEKLTPLFLHSFLQTLLDNRVSKQVYYEILVSEFAKSISDQEPLTFAKLYNVLSDNLMLQEPLHVPTALKLKKSLSSDYVKYDVLQEKQLPLGEHVVIQNEKNTPNSDKKFTNGVDKNQVVPKLTAILAQRLEVCANNAWSYCLNCIRFNSREKIDQDLLSQSVAYANTLIKDITTYADESTLVTDFTLRQIFQLNNFIELEAKKIVPYIKVDQLLDCIHTAIIQKSSNTIPSPSERLFEMHRKQFEIKFQPFLNSFVRQSGILFDAELINQESATVAVFNYLDQHSYNHQSKEKGIAILSKHFANLKKIPHLEVSLEQFQEFLAQQATKSKGVQLPNFVELTLGANILPKKFSVPEEIKQKLQNLQDQIDREFEENKEQFKKFQKQDQGEEKQVKEESNTTSSSTDYYQID